MADSRRSRRRGTALTVLLASSERRFYGGEAQALLLARGLRSRGHRVVLLARDDGELLPRADEAGVDTRPWRPGHGPRALLAGRRVLRGASPDVLHCNDPRALTGAAAVSVGLGIGARIASRRVAFPIRSPFAYRRLADAVVCVSEDVRRACARAGLAEFHLRVVHDGVDPLPLAAGDRRRGRAALAIAEPATIVLTVASLSECKGHDTLLRAMEPILAAMPDAHLVLAGDGPTRPAVQALAEASPCASRIHLLGYRRDVPDLLQAADLFVLPSLQEGLGTALLEAMMVGLPCVASDLGGTAEALDGDADGGPCGWLAPPADPTALAGAIREALERPQEAGLRGRRARDRARQRFTADRMVEGTLGVYREVLGRR